MTHESLLPLLAAYNTASENLIAAVREMFPVGSVVINRQHSADIVAIVHITWEPGMLGLLFENDNVWSKSITDVRPFEGGEEKWPAWVKERKARRLACGSVKASLGF